MSNKRDDRAPREVRGQTDNSSVALYRCTQDHKMTWHERELFREAALTEYEYGEPVALTKARDEVDSWCHYAQRHCTNGLPAVPPAPVLFGMRLRGWTVCA
jgi:hypothetical protein